jgi:hypothetical protein
MSLQFATKAVAPNAASPAVPTSASSTYKSESPTIPISRVFVVPALKAVITKTFISTSCEFAGITIDKDLSVVLKR